MSMLYILTQTVHLIDQFRYWLLFPAVVIEGPIATIIAGLLSAHGTLSFPVSYFVVVTADITADAWYYALGRFGEARISQRLKHRLCITTERLAALQSSFYYHGWKAFVAGKILHGPGAAMLIVAGATRFSFIRFLLINAGITIAKSFVLLLIGYYFGQALGLLQRFLDISALLITGVVIVIGIILYIKYRYRKRNYENSNSN